METFSLFRATRIERGVHTVCLHEPLKESRRGLLRSLGHCSYLGRIGRASSGTLETRKEDLVIETGAPYQQRCCSPNRSCQRESCIDLIWEEGGGPINPGMLFLASRMTRCLSSVVSKACKSC